jgi:hypothetical protein
MPTKDEEATELASKHYEVETGMIQFFRVTGSPEIEVRPTEPIKLLKVNENTVPSGIMQSHFAHRLDLPPLRPVTAPAGRIFIKLLRGAIDRIVDELEY